VFIGASVDKPPIYGAVRSVLHSNRIAHRHVAHERGHAFVGLRHELHLGSAGPP
jgi:hypothetical protein